MTAFEIIPFILFLVVIGTAIAECINVPYPLILVIAGLIVAFIPGMPNWHPPSNIVLKLFLPPILFAAARLISWEDIQTNINKIISLSVVLVIISTLAVGWVLHWIVPHMPLSAALVLGAIISPTDAISATSILNKMNAQRHIVRSIEVESLFNDAISIVLYKVAVLSVFANTISVTQISIHTLLAGFGGITVGLMFSYSTSLIIKEFLTESENELPIIMSLILAYVAYLFADSIGVSSVLAVVAAGLFHKRTEQTTKARTRLSEKAVWGTFVFFLNGLIFIVIGMQFATYLRKVSFIPVSQLILFSVITITLLIVLRFLWITLTAYISSCIAKLRKIKDQGSEFSWREIIVASWSGMRGLVSLALALALPVSITDTDPFPFLNLILFLTIIVILFTVIVQSLTLPYLIKFLKLEKTDILTIKQATKIYRQLTKKAIEHINQLQETGHACSLAARKLVDNYYANRLLRFKVSYETASDTDEVGQEAEFLLAKILDHERKLLLHMRMDGEISEEVYIRILSKIDRDQVGFASYR